MAMGQAHTNTQEPSSNAGVPRTNMTSTQVKVKHNVRGLSTITMAIQLAATG
jgi:hypothetical protein